MRNTQNRFDAVCMSRNARVGPPRVYFFSPRPSFHSSSLGDW